MSNYQSSKVLYIALGSNLNNKNMPPEDVLEKSLSLILSSGISIIKRSSWWKTSPYPDSSGNTFINGVVKATTVLSPNEVINILHKIENYLGRERNATARWRARTCDLDMLSYEKMITPSEDILKTWINNEDCKQGKKLPDTLILPHPRIQDRLFVLAPLLEISPEWEHPLLKLNVEEMYNKIISNDCLQLASMEKAPVSKTIELTTNSGQIAKSFT